MKTKTPAKPKEYITLRFLGGNKSVPILKKVKLCGVEGFAVHRFYMTPNANPIPRMFRVSHIDTGAAIEKAASTIPKAIAAAEAKCQLKGGTMAIAKAIKLTRKLQKAGLC